MNAHTNLENRDVIHVELCRPDGELVIRHVVPRGVYDANVETLTQLFPPGPLPNLVNRPCRDADARRHTIMVNNYPDGARVESEFLQLLMTWMFSTVNFDVLCELVDSRKMGKLVLFMSSNGFNVSHILESMRRDRL